MRFIIKAVTPEQWRQIEELYLAVIDRDPQERERRLAAADTGARREVEAMLGFRGALRAVLV